MTGKQLSRCMAIAMGAVVVFGIARAANSHYAERRTAFFNAQVEERKRLNLTDWAKVKAQYPTPEITLCRAARVAPGATGEVTVRGKFVPGSKFLFENDDVEVVKESASATEYHATVRTAASVGPAYSPLHVFSAISGIESTMPCPAVYIGGKFEWDFTAQNGWRIKLHPKGDFFPKEGSDAIPYMAEFYRGSEAKPFEVRDFPLALAGPLYGDTYSGALTQAENSQAGSMADMQQIMQKMYDPKTSDEERARLTQRMVDLQQQMMNPANAMKQQQEQQQKDAEFGCKNMRFNTNADSTEGQISCGQKTGTIAIKGTRRFVGP